MTSPHHIIDNSQNDDSHRTHHTVVHRCYRHRQLGGPVTEEDDDNDVDHRISVDENTPDARDVERTPHELGAGDIDDGVVAGVVVVDSAGAATPEKKNRHNQIGGVQTRDSHGDDVVEGDGGADVNQTEQTANGHGEEDGVSGEEGTIGDLC